MASIWKMMSFGSKAVCGHVDGGGWCRGVRVAHTHPRSGRPKLGHGLGPNNHSSSSTDRIAHLERPS